MRLTFFDIQKDKRVNSIRNRTNIFQIRTWHEVDDVPAINFTNKHTVFTFVQRISSRTIIIHFFLVSMKLINVEETRL